MEARHFRGFEVRRGPTDRTLEVDDLLFARTVVEVLPMRLIIEAGGVGYDVHIPLSTYDKLPQPGAETKILTHLQVREDAHVLYGFATPEERDLFLLLVNNVSGIGPKLALAVLNGITPVLFRGLVVAGDIAALSKIKGVGKKTAERIIVELRDKVGYPRRGRRRPRSRASRRRRRTSTTRCSRSSRLATSRQRRTRRSARFAMRSPSPRSRSW